MNNNTKITRPAVVTESHLVYLDQLRESAETNMFGAGPYLKDRFGIDGKTAKEILIYWMNSFGERHPI